jgi:hypothetical protein
MMVQASSFQRLRWLAVLLLILLWVTTSSAAALVERGDFGRCAIAAKAPPGMGPGLETRGVRIEGGRKINDTLPQGITDVKNAQGDVFKSVHTPPSAPHAGMSQHVHPNYRNVLPDGSVRSGVSKGADPLFPSRYYRRDKNRCSKNRR